MKILAFNNGGSRGFQSCVAIGEDWRIVGNHCCSHEGFMKGDIGVVGNWHHEEYDSAYGRGNWTIEWVETSDLKTHAGLIAAIAENKKNGKNLEHAPKAGVTATFTDGSSVTVSP